MARRKRSAVANALPDISEAVDFPELDRLRPTLTMLDRSAMERLHRASLEVLRTIGVQVEGEEGLRLLHEAGAVIEEGNVARLSPSLVERALATVPSSFRLYKRGSHSESILADGVGVFFGPGSDTLHYYDPRSQTRRPFLLKDLEEVYRLVDALSGLDFLMSVGVPSDVPTEGYFRKQFAAMVRNCTKPIMGVADSLMDLQVMHMIASATQGGEDNFLKYPTFGMYTEPTTPLMHMREAVEKVLFCAEKGIPVTHSPAPMMGGTAPVTPAGALVLGNAEMLSGLVMHQLKRPGAPFLYGNGIHHLDMKDTVSVYGAPEFQLARVMTAEMARFYHLPAWGYSGHTDSKQVDAQAGVDAQFEVLVALLVRTNINHDVGYVESGLGASPEMMVLTHEIITQTRRFTDGINMDDNSLAMDVIAEVGIGGDYISTEHTMDNWRRSWIPKLFDRKTYSSWAENGSVTIGERLQEVAVGLMDGHKVPALPADVEAQIDAALAL